MREKDKPDILQNVGRFLMKLLCSLLGPLVYVLSPEKMIHKFSQVLTQEQWLRLTAACFVTLLVSLAYIALLKWKENKKPNFKDYDFDPIDQSWRHKTKEEWLCASCKADNVFSPLAFDDDSGMFCPKCGKSAKNLKLKNMLFMSKLSPSVKLEDFAKRGNT